MNTKETMLSGFPLGWTYYVCTERSLGLNHYLHIEAPQWRRCQKKLQTSVTYKWTLKLLPKPHLAFCRLYKELKQLGETIMDSRCCLRNTTGNRKTEEGVCLSFYMPQELRCLLQGSASGICVHWGFRMMRLLQRWYQVFLQLKWLQFERKPWNK